MGKYLKKFDTHSEYSTYINGQDAILPNVSYCVNNKDVHYIPKYLSFKGILAPSGDVEIGYHFQFPYEESEEELREKYPILKKDGQLVDYKTLCENFGWVEETTKDATCSFEFVVPYERFMKVGLGINFVDNIPQYNFQAFMFKKINIPYQITEIGQQGFCELIICEDVNLENVKVFGSSCFSQLNYGAYIETTSFDKPNPIECLNLKSAEEIGDNAFFNCGAKKIIIGNNIKTIGDQAFSGCSMAETITIGNSIESIGNKGFYDCGSANIIINTEEPPTLGENAFHKSIVVGNKFVPALNEDIKIYVPSASVAAYKAASGWSTYADYIFPIQ